MIRNKFALAVCDSKDWIKFSITAFEQPCLRSHSFPKSDFLASLWSQPSFVNQCFPVLVSLFNSQPCIWNHSFSKPGWLTAHVKSIRLWEGSDSLRWLNFENCESEPYTNDVILRISLYCKLFDDRCIWLKDCRSTGMKL